VNIMSNARTRQRNPRGSGQLLRAEIVEAALRVIDAGGVEAVSLRSVAREAGISAPSIYDHFADIDAVLRAVLDAVLAQVTEEIGKVVAANPDPVVTMLEGASAWVSFAERYPHRYAVMHNYQLLTTEQADHGAGPDQGRPFDICVAALNECIAAGRSASTDPFNDSVAIWAGLHGYASLLSVGRRFPWPDRADTLRRIIYGLAKITDPVDLSRTGRRAVGSGRRRS
jgi:AcrR family transcriptional regulator